MGLRLKRIIAWLFDWCIALLPAGLCTFVLKEQFIQEEPAAYIILVTVLVLSPVYFVLRDFLFHGRGIGKRCLGLTVLDRQSNTPASGKQSLVRNLFFFLYMIDGIILLATGETLGDRVTGTRVVPVDYLESDDYWTNGTTDEASWGTYRYEPSGANGEAMPVDYQSAPTQNYAAPPPEYHSAMPQKDASSRTLVVVLIILAAVFLTFIATVVLFAMNFAKNTKEYQLSYAYLVDSEAFAQLDADESDVKMMNYSSSISGGQGDATITFRVDGEYFTVVCHRENGDWDVCGECTEFE